MLKDYDRTKGISTWTKNYRTGIEFDDPDALSREYVYFDPIYTLPEEGQAWWREQVAAGLPDVGWVEPRGGLSSGRRQDDGQGSRGGSTSWVEPRFLREVERPAQRVRLRVAVGQRLELVQVLDELQHRRELVGGVVDVPAVRVVAPRGSTAR